MKYTERISDIENIYEGTVDEIMDLHNKMNSKKKFNLEVGGSCKPTGEIKRNNLCQPIDIKSNSIFEPNINICCEANADKIFNEIAKNLSKGIYKTVGI